MRLGAVPGEFRLEEGAEEEGVRRKLGDPDLPAVIKAAEPQTAAGHGPTLLPESVLSRTGVTSVRVALPRLGHRVELLHAALPSRSPAAALADILTRHV
jgi:hypothetical protein